MLTKLITGVSLEHMDRLFGVSEEEKAEVTEGGKGDGSRIEIEEHSNRSDNKSV